MRGKRRNIDPHPGLEFERPVLGRQRLDIPAAQRVPPVLYGLPLL
jgi:hypothetical protein